MEEALRHAWEDLFGRMNGPMSFRIIVQPIVATILAIRAGWADAREGRPIFFWTLAREPRQVRVMLRNLWRIAGKVFLVAISLDVLYQIIVFQWIYPLQAVIVATLLALVPCMIVRAIGNRIVSIAHRRQYSVTASTAQTESPNASCNPEPSLTHDKQLSSRTDTRLERKEE
jgi:hypothetical protein